VQEDQNTLATFLVHMVTHGAIKHVKFLEDFPKRANLLEEGYPTGAGCSVSMGRWLALDCCLEQE
ncbi:MAG: hypothetical protein RMI90_02435, partial [Thermoguttaceae bacterium]|nr:hypothetical protein [Thermoguttaceae bacterium]